MSVLLMRLAGPMQSWGTKSRFSVRDTEREPSKSGVVGLLSAAMGVSRDDHATIARIADMTMGVRVDREGVVSTDFQTAGGGEVRGERYGVAKASGATPDTVTSTRHYLADASFLVGMESDDEALVRELDAALGNPVWPLYLGRKSYVPGVPVRVGIADRPLEEALRSEPWRPRDKDEKMPERLRLVTEAGPDGRARHDHPVSYEKMDRRFTLRHVEISWIPRADVERGEPTCSFLNSS